MLGQLGFFSASSCSIQEAQGSLPYIKIDCPGTEEAIEVLLNDENDVPEAVEEDESKCFGFFCLERFKSHLCGVVFSFIGCIGFVCYLILEVLIRR